ncbi:helix-turn-helix transcriptional regulator [Kitasatospora sp. NPDC127111]|uniref:helix-turn-helix transcriptional regulator n=1 Tax=Kitasatospora sp. NPDC127111 TaxID=3345363 RepID=UPI0036255A13
MRYAGARRGRFAHRARTDRAGTREFDRTGGFHPGRWWTTGLDHRSGEPRTFRLARIESAAAQDAGFEPPEGFDPVQRATESPATVPRTHEVAGELTATLAEARRIPPAAGTLGGTADGRVLVRARAQDLAGCTVMPAGLGRPFTVRRPDARPARRSGPPSPG